MNALTTWSAVGVLHSGLREKKEIEGRDRIVEEVGHPASNTQKETQEHDTAFRASILWECDISSHSFSSSYQL